MSSHQHFYWEIKNKIVTMMVFVQNIWCVVELWLVTRTTFLFMHGFRSRLLFVYCTTNHAVIFFFGVFTKNCWTNFTAEFWYFLLFFVLFCIRLYSILLCVSIRCIFSRYYFVQKNQHRPDRLLTIFKNIELIWCSLGVVQKLIFQKWDVQIFV